jgi:hypothetical protein
MMPQLIIRQISSSIWARLVGAILNHLEWYWQKRNGYDEADIKAQRDHTVHCDQHNLRCWE